MLDSSQGGGVRVDGTASFTFGGKAPATVAVEVGGGLSMNANGAIVAYTRGSAGAEISDKPAAASGHSNV